MPRLLSRVPLSPRARRRVHLFAIVAFACVAVLSWWRVATEGATAATVITAAFSTIVVVLEVLFPERKRLLRRRASRDAAIEEDDAERDNAERQD